jgi:ABC-type antimicrobial peptide transport system, permease component
MAMPIRPILRALRHHRFTTALIVLEIALACAVLCNACFIVVGKLGLMHIRSGIDEPALAVVTLDNFDRQRADDLNARVVSGLRKVDGVQSVSLISGLPFLDAGAESASPDREGKLGLYSTSFYFGDPGTLPALGVELTAGRLPRDSDVVSADAAIVKSVITRSLADRLWPHADPLGKVFWCCHGTGGFQVIGVAQALIQAGPRDDISVGNAIFTPQRSGSMLAGQYLLRADPARVDEVLRKARAAMATLAPDATVDEEHTGTLVDLRHRYFRSDRATADMLMGTMAALLAITALGIVGLTGYWVQQRRKQIGIRRAIGATRHDILRHFQIENFLIVGMGIALGVLLTYTFDVLLMRFYELPHLPPAYLLVGAVALWLLGQLAVLGPALRAAAVPPVVATRSV